LQPKHQFICTCGKKFKTGEQITEHVTVEAVLTDIRRIGGPRFHDAANRWEKDSKSRGISDFANDENVQICRNNATLIAKRGIAQMVENYENYDIPEYHGDKATIAERAGQLVTESLQAIISVPSWFTSGIRRRATQLRTG